MPIIAVSEESIRAAAEAARRAAETAHSAHSTGQDQAAAVFWLLAIVALAVLGVLLIVHAVRD